MNLGYGWNENHREILMALLSVKEFEVPVPEADEKVGMKGYAVEDKQKKQGLSCPPPGLEDGQLWVRSMGASRRGWW